MERRAAREVSDGRSRSMVHLIEASEGGGEEDAPFGLGRVDLCGPCEGRNEGWEVDERAREWSG